MKKREFLVGSAALFSVLAGHGALAQNAIIDGLNAYLSNLVTAQARFRQENADGSIIRGTFFLKKPGKMRFEYDQPSDSLVVANGQTIAVFDAKSNVSPQRYPQNRTPLSLLSRDNIDVTQSTFVRQIEDRSGRSYVTLFDPEKPQNGSMVLIFTNDPVQLMEWIVVDRSGLETHVYLDDLQAGISLRDQLFNISYNKRIFEREHGG